eukprot:CAMPEP_0176498912 /NCGR_PEP_ID=MMETSP0200_2-20121128/12614_1 /TAXON_ID=947934 /ORGANISM="Chaetoceros sp., Strain GSL56" /LENGTH=461 /DNA_ID=CAMNT_0017897231 /DNA_START=246 /DNA_END=1631 /DNA_ORIENTATION=+
MKLYTSGSASAVMTSMPKLVYISEKVWRTAAYKHKYRIQSLLRPGLIQSRRRVDGICTSDNHDTFERLNHSSLDPMNPVYNFLIDYYGIKGSKGIRRLTRWSPDSSRLLHLAHDHNQEEVKGIIVLGENVKRRATNIHIDASNQHSTIYQAAMEVSHGLGGILLENANENDMGGTLHLRGSIPVPAVRSATAGKISELYGILYNPALYYNNDNRTSSSNNNNNDKTISQYQWYASILQTTLQSEPIFHCHGLHEWAMQYQPHGAPPPPSAKYQANLPLRVSQQVINDTVERKGISCTHVDALRFFAPAAKPLNHHGSELTRTDQLRLEQKACVHAHMDLLKIALKLTPFLDAELLGDVLEVAIEARRLDVEASPYDATAFGVGVVPVETKEGRKLYRDRQRVLMERTDTVRRRLLEAYETFMWLAFGEETHAISTSGNSTSTVAQGPIQQPYTPSLATSDQ